MAFKVTNIDATPRRVYNRKEGRFITLQPNESIVVEDPIEHNLFKCEEIKEEKSKKRETKKPQGDE